MLKKEERALDGFLFARVALQPNEFSWPKTARQRRRAGIRCLSPMELVEERADVLPADMARVIGRIGCALRYRARAARTHFGFTHTPFGNANTG